MKYRTDYRDCRPDEDTHRNCNLLTFGLICSAQKWESDSQESVHADGCDGEYTAVHVGVMDAQQNCTQLGLIQFTESLQYSEWQENNGQEVCDEQVEHVDVGVIPVFDATEDEENRDV